MAAKKRIWIVSKSCEEKVLIFIEREAIIVKQSFNAPVAQLDRVLDYESRGQGFESLLARHNIRSK